MASQYTRECNFIYASKRGTAFPAHMLTTLTNVWRRYMQTSSYSEFHISRTVNVESAHTSSFKCLSERRWISQISHLVIAFMWPYSVLNFIEPAIKMHTIGEKCHLCPQIKCASQLNDLQTTRSYSKKLAIRRLYIANFTQIRHENWKLRVQIHLGLSVNMIYWVSLTIIP